MAWTGEGHTLFDGDGLAGETKGSLGFQGVRATDSAFEIVVAPTIANAGAFASGDYVGANTTPMTFANAAHAAGYSTTLLEVVVSDRDKQSQPLELWIFNATVTLPNSNAAMSISDADQDKCIDVVTVNAWYEQALGSVGRAQPRSKLFTNAAADLYIAIVTRGTPTYTSGGLQIRCVFARD